MMLNIWYHLVQFHLAITIVPQSIHQSNSSALNNFDHVVSCHDEPPIVGALSLTNFGGHGTQYSACCHIVEVKHLFNIFFINILCIDGRDEILSAKKHNE